MHPCCGALAEDVVTSTGCGRSGRAIGELTGLLLCAVVRICALGKHSCNKLLEGKNYWAQRIPQGARRESDFFARFGFRKSQIPQTWGKKERSEKFNRKERQGIAKGAKVDGVLWQTLNQSPHPPARSAGRMGHPQFLWFPAFRGQSLRPRGLTNRLLILYIQFVLKETIWRN
jgi:hypothetical protein